jgi:hypothetical protein
VFAQVDAAAPASPPTNPGKASINFPGEQPIHATHASTEDLDACRYKNAKGHEGK